MKLPAADKSADDPPGDSPVDDHHGNHGNGNSNNGEAVNGQSRGSDSVRERHEDAMFGAIDGFLSSTEQSYEQFVEGFTYFKPGQESNAMSYGLGNSRPIPPSLRQRQSTGQPPPSTDMLPGLAAFLSAHRPIANNPGQLLTPEEVADDISGNAIELSPEGCDTTEGAGTEQEDLLEEEVLGEGLSVPEMLMRPQNTENKPLIKVDNFIVDEEDCETEYNPSDDRVSGELEDDFEPYIASFGPVSGHHTEQHLAESTSVTVDTETYDESSEIMIGQDTCPESGPSAESTCCLYDSTGAPMSDSAPVDSQAADSDSDEELVYDPSKDLPNVGEITEMAQPVELEHGCIVPNVQELNFSTMELSEADKQERESTSESPDERASGTVEPFCLDEDFDYDNVILTPKYNAAEMAILQQAMRRNSHMT